MLSNCSLITIIQQKMGAKLANKHHNLCTLNKRGSHQIKPKRGKGCSITQYVKVKYRSKSIQKFRTVIPQASNEQRGCFVKWITQPRACCGITTSDSSAYFSLDTANCGTEAVFDLIKCHSKEDPCYLQHVYLEQLLLLPPQQFGVFLFLHGNETAFRHGAER